MSEHCMASKYLYTENMLIYTLGTLDRVLKKYSRKLKKKKITYKQTKRIKPKEGKNTTKLLLLLSDHYFT